MPVSPHQQAVSQGYPTDGRKRRKVRQHKRELYQQIREDLQLSGDIPTASEGALRPEQVPSSVQSEQHLPQLIQQAIKRGWSVPEEIKPELVDEMIRLIQDPDVSEKVKVTAFAALRHADQTQYERDHPEQAAKAKGSSNTKLTLEVNNNVQAVAVMNRMIDDPNAGLEDAAALDIASTLGDEGHQRQIQGSTPYTRDQ